MIQVMEGMIKSLSKLCLEYIGENEQRFSADSLQDLPGVVLEGLLPYLSPLQLNKYHQVYEQAGVDTAPIWKRHCSNSHYGSYYGLRVLDPFHREENPREVFMKNIFHQNLSSYKEKKNADMTQERVYGEFGMYTSSLHAPSPCIGSLSMFQYRNLLVHMASHVSKLSLRASDLHRISQDSELLVRLQGSVKTLVLSNIQHRAFEDLAPLLHALICCGQLERLELTHCKFTVAQWRNLLAHASGKHYCGATVAGTEHGADCRFRQWSLEHKWLSPCLCMYQTVGKMPSLPEDVLKAQREVLQNETATYSSCEGNHTTSKPSLVNELQPQQLSSGDNADVDSGDEVMMQASTSQMTCTSDDGLMDDVLSAHYGSLERSATTDAGEADEGLYSNLDTPCKLPHAWPRIGRGLSGFVCLQCNIKWPIKHRMQKQGHRVPQPCCLPAMIALALRSWSTIRQLAVPGKCCGHEADLGADKMFSCRDYASVLAWHLQRDDFTHLVFTPTFSSDHFNLVSPPTFSCDHWKAVDRPLVMEGLCERREPLQLLDCGESLPGPGHMDNMETFLALPGVVSIVLHSLHIPRWTSIGEQLGKWTLLRDLDLNGFEANDVDCGGLDTECLLEHTQRQWIEILKHCHSLETLLLSGSRNICQVKHVHWLSDHLEEFAILVVKHPSLSKLSLKGAALGELGYDNGARLVYLLFALALEERRPPRLRHLDLSDCQIQGSQLLTEVKKIQELWDSRPNARPFLKDLKLEGSTFGGLAKDCIEALEKINVKLEAHFIYIPHFMADFLAQM